MAYNIQMNILNSSGTYDILYPETLGSLVSGAVSSATQLATSRTIRTNLASTSTASFNGTANITPGVTGTLPIANGGTGNTTGNAATATKLATARTIQTSLSSTSSASFDGSASITPGVTGTLPIANGGTGATTASSAIYGLTNGLTTRAASSINSYASSTYVPCYYSTTGYKFPISNLLTYIQNNVSSGSSLKLATGTHSGTGTSSGTISLSTSFSSPLLFAHAEKSSSSASYPGMSGYASVSGLIYPSSNAGSELFIGFNLGENASYITPQSKVSSTSLSSIYVKLASSTSLTFTLGSTSGTTFNVSGNTYYWYLIGY